MLFRSITSLINMFEAVCESWQTRFGMPHSAMAAACGIIAFGIGVFIEDGNKVGAWMDFITILVVPFGALLGAFSIYYILGWNEIGQELSTGRRQPLGTWFCTLGKYIYVPLAVFVFILGIAYGGIG